MTRKDLCDRLFFSGNGRVIASWHHAVAALGRSTPGTGTVVALLVMPSIVIYSVACDALYCNLQLHASKGFEEYIMRKESRLHSTDQGGFSLPNDSIKRTTNYH